MRGACLRYMMNRTRLIGGGGGVFKRGGVKIHMINRNRPMGGVFKVYDSKERQMRGAFKVYDSRNRQMRGV